MKIAVLGLGYVGATLAACLVRDGHEVVGVDIDPEKVASIRNGRSPVGEPGLPRLVADAVAEGRLSATTDTIEAVTDSDITFICVGTPSGGSGGHDYGALTRAVETVGEALATIAGYPVVTVRSTLAPGTTEMLVIPGLEAASGKRCGTDFGVAVNPEFLREGSAIEDFDAPPKTVVAASDERAFKRVHRLYETLRAPLFRVSFKEAEMIKHADNAWHALKVDFGNEIGALCRGMGVDSHGVMEMFLADTKLNISPAYLRPGFAFGGSCLPKDVRSLAHIGDSMGLDLPLLNAIMPSNRAQVERALHLVEGCGDGTVGLAGLVFKPGTDDFRESPLVTLARRLVDAGRNVRLYDPWLLNDRGAGRYLEVVARELPEIRRCAVPDANALLAMSDIVVLGVKGLVDSDSLRDHMARLRIVDLVREFQPPYPEHYAGIAW